MVRPAYRSRSLRRVKVRTPGGDVHVHYEKRFAGVPRCALSGVRLQGMDKRRIKTRRVRIRPVTRPYGGYISHRVLSRAIRLAVRLG